MKSLCLALLLAALALDPLQRATAAEDSPSNKSLVIAVSIPAPLSEVWKAFTTSEGLSTWLAPNATVDLRVGGDWIVHFPGSSAGGTIVSFTPQHDLVISALAPDKFPTVRARRTRADFQFTADGNVTVVRLTQTGWQTGSEWDSAYEYLIAGNAQLLATLHRRFVNGPINWDKE